MGGANPLSSSRGERCWFAVEAKTFDLSVEVVGGKLKGIIVERSRGFFAWIRFWEQGLSCLLEGVETCCREGGLRRSTT